MWIDPPANTSAPDDTAPSTVTSPCGNRIAWPERTGSSIMRNCGGGGGGGTTGAASLISTVPPSRPPTRRRFQGSAPGISRTFSTSMTEIPQASMSAIRVAMPSVPALTAARSTITGRASKNPGERTICARNASSQPAKGASGAITKAMKDRPRTRICMRG